MSKQLTSGSFVVLLERPGKSTYRYGDLQNMYPGDEPIVIWGPPETPGIIGFQKKQRQILVIQDRLHIEAQLSSPEIVTGDFAGFAKKALRAAANQEVKAYGSNFFFLRLAGVARNQAIVRHLSKSFFIYTSA